MSRSDEELIADILVPASRGEINVSPHAGNTVYRKREPSVTLTTSDTSGRQR